MPIRRQYRWVYPIDWRELSISVRFRRAKGRCEHCDRPHGKTVSTSVMAAGGMRSKIPGAMAGEGLRSVFRPLTEATVVCTTRVVFATAHLDHDPTNNRPRNLAAICQRCHILHDGEEHRRRRWLTYRVRRALGDLFTGPYR